MYRITHQDIPGVPEKPMIVVGSQNKPKIEATKQVFLAIWPEATIISVAAPSGVPEQPWGSEETMRGAIHRSRTALAAVPGADIGVGLEGGVEQGPGEILFLSGWAAVALTNGRLGVGGGGRTPIPPELADMLLSGLELGPAIDKWLGRKGIRHAEGTIGVLTGGHLTRTASFANLLQHALAPILHPGWYMN